jgi:outer membrane protein
MKHQNSIQWAKRSLVALISAGMLAPVMAQDVGNRVAVVNSEKVFNESNLAKAMQTRLQNEFTKRQNELRDSAQKIKLAAENDKKQKTIDSWVDNKIGNAYVRIDKSYESCDFRNNWIKTNDK